MLHIAKSRRTSHAVRNIFAFGTPLNQFQLISSPSWCYFQLLAIRSNIIFDGHALVPPGTGREENIKRLFKLPFEERWHFSGLNCENHSGGGATASIRFECYASDQA